MTFRYKRWLSRSVMSRRQKCLMVSLMCWCVIATYVLVSCSSTHAHSFCTTPYLPYLSAMLNRRSENDRLAEKSLTNNIEKDKIRNETAHEEDNRNSSNSRLEKEIRYNIDNKRHLKLQQAMLAKGRPNVNDEQDGVGPSWKTTLSPEQIQRLENYFTPSNRTVNPLERRFNILNDKICKNDSLQMIILVPSVPENFEVRTAIRYTFGILSKDHLSQINGVRIEYMVRVAFLLGRGPNHTVEQGVRRENAQNKDIVEIDFVDSYYNLTLKILHGLKWAQTFCSKVNYVVKSDEDVFLNTAELIKQLKLHDEGPNGAIFGTIFHKQLTVLREGRWGVSRDQYPPSRYPEYAQGNSYTISGKLLPKIVEAAQKLPYIPIEDAFITGIVAGKFCGARLITIHGNSNWQEKTFVPNPCKFVKYNWVSTTNMTPLLMYRTFAALKNYRSKCYSFIDKKLIDDSLVVK